MNNDYVLVDSLNQKMEDLESDINELHEINVITNSIIGNIDNSVNDVNKEIKKINSINRKRVCIRNIKVFRNILKLIIHPIIAIALAFSFSHFVLNDIPFYRQDRVNTMRYEETIDSLGNEELNNWYSDVNWFMTKAEEKNNWLYKYGKWEKRGNGYYRDVDEFIIGDYPKNNIKELFDNSSKLRDTYGFLETLKYETTDKVTEEELALENYMKAVYHYTDENDYIIIPQSEEENRRDNFFFLGMLFGFGVMSAGIINSIINDRLNSGQKAIGEDYTRVDIEDIKKQFHDKRMELEKTKKQLKKERTI